MAGVVPVTGGRAARVVVRVGWVAIRLGLVIYFGSKGTLFFYQGF